MTWLLIPSLIFASLLSIGAGHLPLAIIMGFLALAGGVQLASGRWQMGAFPAPLSYLLICFTLWAGLSALWSQAPFDTWRAVSVLLLLPAWAWMIASLKPSYIKKLVVAAAGVILILSLIAFAQMASVAASASDQFRAASLFANPNTFAALIITILLPLQHIWFARVSEISKNHVMIFTGFILVAFFAALVLTISRIALGAYIGITILQMVMLRDSLKPDWKRIAIYIACLAAIYFALNYTGGNKIIQRMEYITHPISTHERILVWQTTWQAFLQQPLFGHGFGALSVPYAALRHPDDGTYGQFAHSDGLQYLAELGPIGFILALGLVLSFVFMTMKRLRDGFQNRQDAVWFAAAATGILACFGSALVTYIFYLPAIILLVALLLGLWAALYWIDDEPLTLKSRPVSALAFLGCVVLLAGFHVSAFMSDKADTAIRQFSIERHLFWNQWASRLSFRLNPMVTLEWMDVLMSQATQEKKPEQFAQLDLMFEKLETLQPSLPQLWMQRARMRIAQGKLIEAEAHLQRALLLDPTLLPARLFLGRLWRETGRDDKLINDLYAEALRWQLTDLKYGVTTMAAMEKGEDNLPRLLPANGKSR